MNVHMGILILCLDPPINPAAHVLMDQEASKKKKKNYEDGCMVMQWLALVTHRKKVNSVWSLNLLHVSAWLLPTVQRHAKVRLITVHLDVTFSMGKMFCHSSN